MEAFLSFRVFMEDKSDDMPVVGIIYVIHCPEMLCLPPSCSVRMGSVNSGGRGNGMTRLWAMFKKKKRRAVCSQAAAACHPLMQPDFYLSLGNSFEGSDVFIVMAWGCLCVCICSRARSKHDSRVKQIYPSLALEMYFESISAGHSTQLAQWLMSFLWTAHYTGGPPSQNDSDWLLLW